MSSKKYPAVYIYKKTSDKGRELKYSIRSLANVKNWNGQVFVSGDREDWFSPEVKVIDTFTKSHDKQLDAQSKLRAITESKAIEDDFIFFNDDFFVVEPTEIKPLYDGKLEGAAGKNTWQQSKFDTRIYLQENGIESPLNYAIHVPIVLNKQKLADVLDIIEANRDKRLMMRSLYGNLYKIGGTQYEDRKTQSQRLKSGPLLSTTLFAPELEKLFPTKSIFEKE